MRANRIFAALLLATAFGTGCATTGAVDAGPVAVERPTGEDKPREISPAAKRKFGDAVRAYNDGLALKVVDWDALARKFQTVVDEDAAHAEAWFNLGVIAERRGLPDEAAGHYRRAIEAKPTLKAAYENLAVLMENAGDRAGAEEQYKNVLRAYPADAGARARLAVLYREGGDNDRALELAREALLREPKNLTAHKVVAQVHLERGQLSLAKLVTLRGIGYEATDAELVYLLGEIREKEGDPAAALAQYRQVVQLREDHLPARAKVAAAALEARNFDEAASHYGAILRHDEKNVGAQLDLAIALRGLGKIDEALAGYRQVLVLAPNDPRPQYGIASILHRHKDQPEEALAHYREFISGNSMNLPAEHPVFADLRECEQLVALKLEEKAMAQRAAEEAAREAQAAGGAGAGEQPAGEATADASGEAAPAAAAPAEEPAAAEEELAPAPAPQQAGPAPAPQHDPEEPDDDF
ncbi:adventurous gliding motility TPR repeat lipoprotein GltE [Vulgatibacter sp.]|uniref:adventurous gliding motility TPR repeat lipoprotein GltE n=1 Tax=Vulgatibacter sp. TaxID=1971226 RepID=UPI0035658721